MWFLSVAAEREAKLVHLLRAQRDKYEKLKARFRDVQQDLKAASTANRAATINPTIQLDKLIVGGKATLARAQKDLEHRRRDELRRLLNAGGEAEVIEEDIAVEEGQCYTLRRCFSALYRFWLRIFPLNDDLRCMFPYFFAR